VQQKIQGLSSAKSRLQAFKAATQESDDAIFKQHDVTKQQFDYAMQFYDGDEGIGSLTQQVEDLFKEVLEVCGVQSAAAGMDLKKTLMVMKTLMSSMTMAMEETVAQCAQLKGDPRFSQVGTFPLMQLLQLA
jgi:hypothetical protein